MRGSKSARGIRPNVRTFKLEYNLSGKVSNKAENFLRPDQAVDIVNMHCREEGSWSAHMVGYTAVNSTPFESAAKIDGLSSFVDSNSTTHLFAVCNGKLIDVNMSTGAGTILDSSLTANVKPDFLAMGGALFIVDGVMATPRKVSHSGSFSVGNSAGWPITDGVNTYTTPKYAEPYQGRGVYANFPGKTAHIAISAFEDAEDFTVNNMPTGAYIAEVGVGDGQPITGMRVIHIPASNTSQLVIFKSKSTYVLTGNSANAADPDFFRIVELNKNYGALNNRAIVQLGNDLLALNQFGITSFGSSNQSGTLQPIGISSDSVRDVIERLNISAIEQAWGIHLPHRREVIWWIPTGSSSVANEAIVYKYPSPGTDETPKWSRRTNFTFSHGVLIENTLYVGNYAGKVLTVFTSSSANGLSIDWVYEYPFIDFGNKRQNKRYLSGTAIFKIRSPQNVNIEYTWRGNGVTESGTWNGTIGTETLGAVYGAAVFGVAYYGANTELFVPYDVFGDGLQIKHKLSGSALDSGPDFLGLDPVIELGNISQS